MEMTHRKTVQQRLVSSSYLHKVFYVKKNRLINKYIRIYISINNIRYFFIKLIVSTLANIIFNVFTNNNHKKRKSNQPCENSGNFFSNGNDASAYNFLALKILVSGLVPLTTNIWFTNNCLTGCSTSDKSNLM